MLFYQFIYYFKIFCDFKGIEAINYWCIIYFYEDWEDMICGLDFEEYFEMFVVYVNSFFEVGFY